MSVSTENTEKSSIPTLEAFLTNVPPGRRQIVSIQTEQSGDGAGSRWYNLKTADIRLHCDNPDCGGERNFRNIGKVRLSFQEAVREDKFIVFACNNCQTSYKTFALEITRPSDMSSNAEVIKYGEDPAFGPPLPKSLSKMAGGQLEILRKGRRCESQGLGIAAFAYYRRVVEELKNSILDELIRVSTTLKADNALIAELEAAKGERRFTQAIEGIKHGLPQAILISGHNPLTLLHNALSEGLHAGTDEECLEIATSIREVLSELVERMAQAIKDDVSLNKAVGKLLKIKQAKQ
ncbi:hypothetical protein [Paraburkholderia silvatlantica]|uniref:hypothetical protein n=1 Tax=Paraburkholderia silvatlantica TaxID=321895 RepID=UPI0037504E8F